MKINYTESNSFKGLYLVKGTGRQVADVSRKIYERCSNPETKNIIKFTEQLFEEKPTTKETIKGFTNCMCEMLTGLYGDRQPLVQMLVATNEDSEIIEEYYDRLFALSSLKDEENPDEVHLAIVKNRIAKYFKKNAEKFIEYNQAQRKFMNSGDASSLAHFIVKQAVQAKNKLVVILVPFNKKESNISVLRAEDVSMAIEKDSFDYINGCIR